MNFADILNRKAEEIQKPKNLPAGHYIASVKALPSSDMIAQGKFSKLSFQLVIQQACEDIDTDEIAAFGAPIQGQLIKKDFLFTTDPAEERSFQLSENQLKAFLQNLDIGFTETSSMTLGEALNASVGAFIKVEISHRADKNDPTNLFTDVGRTAPAN